MMTSKEKILDKAQKLIQKGSLDKAIQEYRAAAELDPRDTSIRLRIGDLYVKMGMKSEAVKEYTEAARANMQRGFYLKAIAVYKQVLKLDETNLDVHNKLAELYVKQRLIADAISEYSYIVNVFERKGKTSEVMELLKKMVDTDPDNVGIRLKLAELYLKLSFDKDAFAEYSWIFEKLVSQGKLDTAEKIYTGLFNAGFKEPEILKGLCDIYRKRGDDRQLLRYGKPLFCYYRDSADLERATELAVALLEIKSDDQDCLTFMERFKPRPLDEPAPEEPRRPERETPQEPAEFEEGAIIEEAAPVIEAAEEIEISLEGFEEVFEEKAQEASVAPPPLETAPAEEAPEPRQPFVISEDGEVEIDLPAEAFTDISGLLSVRAAATVEPAAEPVPPPSVEAGEAPKGIEIATEPPPVPEFSEGAFAEPDFSAAAQPKEEGEFKFEKWEEPAQPQVAVEEAAPAEAPHIEVEAAELAQSPVTEAAGAEEREKPLEAVTEEREPAAEIPVEIISEEPAREPSGVFSAWEKESEPAETEEHAPLEEIIGSEIEDGLKKLLEYEEPAHEKTVEEPPGLEAEPEEEIEVPVEEPQSPVEEAREEKEEPGETKGAQEEEIAPQREIEEPAAEKVSEPVEAAAEFELREEAGEEGAGAPVAMEEESPAVQAGPVGPELPQEEFELKEEHEVVEAEAAEEFEIIRPGTAARKTEDLGFELKGDEAEEKLPEAAAPSVVEEARPPYESIRPEEAAPPQELKAEEISETITELVEKIEHEEAPGENLIDVKEEEPERAAEPVAEEKPKEPYVDLTAELGMEEALNEKAGKWAEGESQETISEFKSGIGKQLSREDAETHYNLGIAYMEMELFSEAGKEFKIALKDPELEFDCYTRLGLCSMAESNPHEAVMYYLKGLKLSGRSEEERKGIMYELGLSYEAAGEVEEAAHIFESIHAIDPGFRQVALKVMKPRAAELPMIPLDDGLIEVELL